MHNNNNDNDDDDDDDDDNDNDRIYLNTIKSYSRADVVVYIK